jgi:ribosomal protein L11 methyltransferase
LGRVWPALDVHLPDSKPRLLDLVLAELDDFQPTAIQEHEPPQPLRVFFASTANRDAASRGLAFSFCSLLTEPLDVDDEDWAARSQAQLEPVTIGGLTIAAPWHETARNVAQTGDSAGEQRMTIIIRPSMGFGTGHHATTRLVLKALQNLPLSGKRAIDVGCGSGVLAISAVKLGARESLAIDDDPDALANARENASLNGVSGQVRFEEGDYRTLSSTAEIVLANLTGGLLEQSAPQLAALVEHGGWLVVSGFLAAEQSRVLAALETMLTLKSIDQEAEWRAAVFENPS